MAWYMNTAILSYIAVNCYKSCINTVMLLQHGLEIQLRCEKSCGVQALRPTAALDVARYRDAVLHDQFRRSNAFLLLAHGSRDDVVGRLS